MRPDQNLIEMDALASERSIPMLRKTMIVLATAAALTGGLTADAFARGGGGGGHMGGGGGHQQCGENVKLFHESLLRLVG